MISFDDTIKFFKGMEKSVNKEDREKYICAINRLNYENDKSKGAEIKQIKKLNEKGCIKKCGNCGNEAVKEAWYKYCPNCGYWIIRK